MMHGQTKIKFLLKLKLVEFVRHFCTADRNFILLPLEGSV